MTSRRAHGGPGPWVWLVGVALLAPLLASACAPREPVHIGFLLGAAQGERWRWDRDLIAGRCEELGARLTTLQSDRDPELQQAQARELLDRGVDALLVMPQSRQAGTRIALEAQRRGVPSIAYDRLILDAPLDLYVSFDNVRVGELQALAVYRRRPRGRYVLIGGSPEDPNAALLRKGQMRTLGPALERGDVTLVADDFTPAWNRAAARALMERLLASSAGVDAIVASNDVLAGEAIAALAAHGLAGEVPVSGQDADLAACRRIVAGTQTATVYKPFWLLAKRGAEAAVALARGEPVGQDLPRVANGHTQVVAMLLEPVLVDRENMAHTVVKDGYHALDAVYADVPPEEWPKVY